MTCVFCCFLLSDAARVPTPSSPLSSVSFSSSSYVVVTCPSPCSTGARISLEPPSVQWLFSFWTGQPTIRYVRQTNATLLPSHLVRLLPAVSLLPVSPNAHNVASSGRFRRAGPPGRPATTTTISHNPTQPQTMSFAGTRLIPGPIGPAGPPTANPGRGKLPRAQPCARGGGLGGSYCCYPCEPRRRA